MLRPQSAQAGAAELNASKAKDKTEARVLLIMRPAIFEAGGARVLRVRREF
jgi:hypothetical protein